MKKGKGIVKGVRDQMKASTGAYDAIGNMTAEDFEDWLNIIRERSAKNPSQMKAAIGLGFAKLYVKINGVASFLGAVEAGMLILCGSAIDYYEELKSKIK